SIKWPPREDINSPDLYIPAMAFVTYVLLTGIVAGTKHKFHPEVLGINATTGLLLVILELLFIKIGCYLLNITSETQFLDFLSYSGYKFIGVIITLVVSLIAPFWFVIGTFFYTAFANGFFLLRSLRYVVFPDSTNTVQVPQRKRRIHFLFVVSALQGNVLCFVYIIIYGHAATEANIMSKRTLGVTLQIVFTAYCAFTTTIPCLHDFGTSNKINKTKLTKSEGIKNQ
ncbi:7853_t:CDS:2, partial [Entrophospora sp. SA101]